MVWNAIAIRKKPSNGITENAQDTTCNIVFSLFIFVLLSMILSVYDYEHSKEELVANITSVKCNVMCEVKNFNNCLYNCNINFTYNCNNQLYAYHQKLKSSYNFESEKVIVIDTYHCTFYDINIYIKYFIIFLLIFIIAVFILLITKEIIEKRNKYHTKGVDSKMLIPN
jgi:hypothetical protein